jgi:hypothetical protein
MHLGALAPSAVRCAEWRCLFWLCLVLLAGVLSAQVVSGTKVLLGAHHTGESVHRTHCRSGFCAHCDACPLGLCSSLHALSDRATQPTQMCAMRRLLCMVILALYFQPHCTAHAANSCAHRVHVFAPPPHAGGSDNETSRRAPTQHGPPLPSSALRASGDGAEQPHSSSSHSHVDASSVDVEWTRWVTAVVFVANSVRGPNPVCKQRFFCEHCAHAHPCAT